MRYFDLALSPVAFAHGGPVQREAPRPPLARASDYEDRVDLATLFYDCFWSARGDAIICVGPRLGTFEDLLRDTRFVARPSGTPIEAEIDSFGTLAQIVLPVPSGTTDVLTEMPSGTRIITPQPQEQDLFRDKRVLLTLSMNNPLHWIRDWVWFYVRTHGTNAVLFYDNASTFYAKEDIAAALAPIQGLELLVIPSWPFRFGAPKESLGPNDSRFSQRGVLSHARQRFLQKAASVIHCDIDELILPLGDQGLHEAAETARTGYLQIGGTYLEHVTEDGQLPGVSDITFGTWRYSEARPRKSTVKWAVSPRRHAPRVYWSVHRIFGRKPDAEVSARFSLRHVYGMKTPDTDTRNVTRLANTPTIAPDPESHRIDEAYCEFVDRVFGDPSFAQLPAVAPFAHRKDPDAARILAGEAYRKGQMSRAMELLDHAIALAPDRPAYHEFRATLLSEEGLAEAAKAAADRALDIRLSDPANANEIIREARGRADLDTALQIAGDALRRNPGDARLHLAMSDVLGSANRQTEAAEYANKAHELGLDTIRLHWRRGLSNLRAGNLEIAAESYANMQRVGITSQVDWVRYWRGVIRLAQLQGRTSDVPGLAIEALAILEPMAETTAAERAEFRKHRDGDQGAASGS